MDRKADRDDVDPVTTQIIRNSLNSAAEQMKRALCRTAMSPIIYEVLDFAGAIYDNHMRLLAQAPSLPLFMGTLNFCIEEAVKGVGGEKNKEPLENESKERKDSRPATSASTSSLFKDKAKETEDSILERPTADAKVDEDNK